MVNVYVRIAVPYNQSWSCNGDNSSIGHYDLIISTGDNSIQKVSSVAEDNNSEIIIPRASVSDLLDHVLISEERCAEWIVSEGISKSL